MEITVLIENLGPENLAREHGLSVHIRFRGHSILLDTGSSGAFADNAKALGIDLSTVEFAVLSHGHYDHADGLRAFFSANDSTPMLVRRGALGPYYSIRGGTPPRFVGVHREICRDYAHRLVEVDGLYELMDGAWLVPNPAPEASPDRAQHLYKKLGEDQFVEDDFSHEHSLVLECSEGLAILNSCCHAGSANIASHIAGLFPGKPIAALLGGFHMMGATGTDSINCSTDYVRTVADEFKRLDIARIYTGHCTGHPAFALLQEQLGSRLGYMKTGKRIILAD
ncbi:MAG: MBL fold metallo-hydrolase [Ruminococcaceae bacterium]|nr:MBL fold metallo-hydrolase [Oscillospiraceae bacterium]